MHAQWGKIRAFLAFAFGAPLPHAGMNIRHAHAHMHISEARFDAVAGHLDTALHDLAVPQGLISEVVAIAVSTKVDVMNT